MTHTGIGALSRSAYNSELRQIQIEYNQRYRKAARAYRERKGYKIAWNFANSPEGERILQLKKRAIYRLNRRYLASFFSDLNEWPGGDPAPFDRIFVLENNFFWNVSRRSILERIDLSQAAGITAYMAIYDEDTGLTPYFDRLQMDLALMRANRRANEREIRGQLYPIVELRAGVIQSTDQIFYLVKFIG